MQNVTSSINESCWSSASHIPGYIQHQLWHLAKKIIDLVWNFFSKRQSLSALEDQYRRSLQGHVQHISLPNEFPSPPALPILEYLPASTRKDLPEPLSQPIQNLRELIRQIAVTALEIAIENKASDPTKTISEFYLRCVVDIFSERMGEFIQHLNFSKNFDDLLRLVLEETNGHSHAISATEQFQKTLQTEDESNPVSIFFQRLTIETNLPVEEQLQRYYFLSFIEKVKPAQEDVLNGNATDIFLENLVQKALNELYDLFQDRIDELLIPKEIMQKRYHEAWTLFNAQKHEVNKSFILSELTPFLVKELQKWIEPEKLQAELVRTIYPAVQNQMLKTIFTLLTTSHWNIFGPLLFAYNIASHEKKKELAGQIKEKLFIILQDNPIEGFTLSAETLFDDIRILKIVEMMLYDYQEDQLVIRRIILDNKNNEKFETFAYCLYKVFQDIPENREAIINHICEYLLALAELNKELNIQEIEKDQLQEFKKNFIPLFEKMEKRIAVKLESETFSLSETPFDLVCEAINEVLSDKPLKTNDLYGKLVFNLLAVISPKLSHLANIPPVNWIISSFINTAASGALEPYCQSHELLTKVITDSLSRELIADQGAGLDKQKVKELFFDPPKEVKLDKDLPEQIELLAKLTFALAILAAGAKQTGKPSLLQKSIKSFILGESPEYTKKILMKVNDLFTQNIYVNKNRIAAIINFALGAFNDTKVALDADNGSFNLFDPNPRLT